MSFSQRLLLAVIATAALSACSGGGSLNPKAAAPQQKYHVTTTQSYSTGPFLYTASVDRVNLYKLPLTTSSLPYATIYGFQDARDVKVENNDLDVADSTFGYNALVTFDQVQSTTTVGVSFTFDCFVSFQNAFAEAIHSDHLYVVQQYNDLYPILGSPQYMVEYSEDTPCSPSYVLAYTSNGLDVPRGVAANDHYIFVANSNGESIAAFSQPLHTNDSPVTVTPLVPAATNIVANNTALYVISYNNGLERFALPLTTTSTPTATIPLPPCTNGSAPYGVEDYNGYVYVSDPECGNIYLFKKPVYTNQSPTYTFHIFATGIDIH